MKIIILLSILLILVPQQKQAITYSKLDNPNLVRIFNKLSILSEFSTRDSTNNLLSIRVLALPNEPGSAGFNNCEVTTNIYIAVSEYDLAPEQNVFQLNPLYWPKVEKIDTIGNTVFLSFIPDSNRVTLKIKCFLSHLQIELIK
jgi:hypothetical protein